MRQLASIDRYIPTLCDFVAEADHSAAASREVTPEEMKTYLQERLRLYPNAINWRLSKIDTKAFRLRMRKGGMLIITLDAEFPPTEQAPGVFLDERAVLSFYTSACATQPEQRRLLERVFDTDARLRCGYGRSLLALARHMTVTRSCCVDSEAMVCRIDRLIHTLRSAYLRLSVRQGEFLPPRESFTAASRVFEALLELPLTIEDRLWVGKGLGVLAAAAAEYDLAVSLCPLQNPQHRRDRVEMPDFDRALQRPLSQTSCERPELDVKEAVRLAGRLGIKGVHSIKYAAAAFGLYGYLEVVFGQRGRLIVQLDGNLAVHVVFDCRRSLRTYLQNARIDPQILTALKRYYHKPQNRALLKCYDRNLSAILKAFSDLSLSGSLNGSQQRAVKRSLKLLLSARRKLLVGLVPDLLLVYQKISDNIEQIQDHHQELNAPQRNLLSLLYDRLLTEGVEVCLAIAVLDCCR